MKDKGETRFPLHKQVVAFIRAYLNTALKMNKESVKIYTIQHY